MRVLPDKIEVVSHPGPDRSITAEGLRTYRVFNRRYRNRRIGEFLKEMHLTEGRNTGFNQKQQEANDTIQITEREVSVLKYLEKEPFASREQIAMEFEVSKATVGRITAELKIKQLLERRGESKKGRWIVKWPTES